MTCGRRASINGLGAGAEVASTRRARVHPALWLGLNLWLLATSGVVLVIPLLHCTRQTAHVVEGSLKYIACLSV